MATSKKIIFLFLLLFPFGQLINIGRLHPIDLIVIPSLFYLLYDKPYIFKYLKNFITIVLFSLIFSLLFFKPAETLVGWFYLLRFVSYISFFVLVWTSVKNSQKFKNTLYNSLILVSAATAVFGWIQYFWLPDLRTLKLLGWDDHYFRLVGTFLDPGFTSIILVFGFLLTFLKYLKYKNNRLLTLLGFFVLTIAFTYSRAGYFALFAGIFTICLWKKNFRLFLLLALSFSLLLLALPRPASSGVELGRTYSIISRFDDYQKTFNIFTKSPIFGIGFNNLCVAKDGNFGSHSCTGSDSSLLLVLATTGIVGFMVFFDTSLKILKSVKKDVYGIAFYYCSAGLVIHSLFLNSLFYPWVMGFMGILLAISIKEKNGE